MAVLIIICNIRYSPQCITVKLGHSISHQPCEHFFSLSFFFFFFFGRGHFVEEPVRQQIISIKLNQESYKCQVLQASSAIHTTCQSKNQDLLLLSRF